MIRYLDVKVIGLMLSLMVVNTSAAVTDYTVSSNTGLFGTNLALLSEFTDTSDAVFVAEFGGYVASGGTISGSFSYDNQAAGYLALSNTVTHIGDFQSSSALGGVVVSDGTFNASVPYDPEAPLVDGLSLHLGNGGTPGFVGFAVGDWTLTAVSASWFGGEFISSSALPVELQPSNGFENNFYTLIFENSLSETAYVSSAGMQVSSVPVPAAAWLFSSALIGLIGVKRKK